MKAILLLRNGQRFKSVQEYDELERWLFFDDIETASTVAAFGPLWEDHHLSRWLIRRTEVIAMKPEPRPPQ